jgi:flagellar assembly protein FliH
MMKNDVLPEYEIGSFKDENFTVEESNESSENNNILNDLTPILDSSVASWEFPLIERKTKESEEEDFKAKIAKIEKEAYEKGFEQGHKDGLMLEEKKLEEMGKELEALFTGLRDLKEQIYRESEGEVLKISILTAKKIIGEEIRTNQNIISNNIRSALNFLTDKRKLKIIINPEDMEDVRRILPDIAGITRGGQLQLSEDNSIRKGGCILETGFGRINATIEDQIRILEEELEDQYRAKMDKKDGPLS